ncbi:hypothetical protein BJ993_002239 [Nocardioides aromaticivorans]|uniref:Lipoprotein n=1 Tax=Nocardioides aromaticivorans TaxID=200618 RepID=A0A7Y9ZGR9_9ACTN|nr:hypothetical protein [Nocardioides aromaticivorans]NYI45159.1 hypothetical protein [Nocardioides aromaticivorans]
MKSTLGPAALTAVLSLALLGLVGCGDEPAAAPDPSPTQASTPASEQETQVTQAPTVEGPADLVAIFTEAQVAELRAGSPTVADDGTGITAELVERGGRDQLQVRNGSDVVTATIPEDADTPYLLDVQLELGQAGAGWVVGHEGGDSTRLTVYVIRAGRLVPATPTPGDPDLGGGFTPEGGTRRTWFDAAGQAFTRVATGRPDQYRLYRWAVSGPGEGGGTDDLDPRLVAEDLGTVCVTESATPVVVERC